MDLNAFESLAMDEEGDEEEEFGFSRNYFLARELGSSSRKKSGRKLSEIDLVDEQVLRAAVSEIRPKNEAGIEALLRSYKDQYSKWLFVLRCGFGLLMYGFGSKKVLLEDFASTALTDYDVIVINGYLPSINIKPVVVTIAELLQDKQQCRRKVSTGNKQRTQQQFNTLSIDDLLTYLNEEVEDVKDSFVCLVIHNIDGPALRDSESQQYLARIACCSNVRVIASIDHVNAPLSQCARTATIVLQSLNPNAQSVFKVLAEYQLANEKAEGMPGNTLYTKCRERFLVSSQVTLNSHLTEFRDHGLLKARKHSDCQDCLYIPLSSEALQKLLSDLG